MAAIMVGGEAIMSVGRRAVTAAKENIKGWEDQYGVNQSLRDGEDSYHVTLALRDELDAVNLPMKRSKRHLSPLVDKTLPELKGYLEQDTTSWIDVGYGIQTSADNKTFYRIICWPAVAAWRASLGLEWKDLHITIGFKDGDIHGKKKGLRTLSNRYGTSDSNKVIAVLDEIQSLVRQDPSSSILIPLAEMALSAAKSCGDNYSILYGQRLLCNLLVVRGDFGRTVEIATSAITTISTSKFGKNTDDIKFKRAFHSFLGLAHYKLHEYKLSLEHAELAVSYMQQSKSRNEAQLIKMNQIGCLVRRKLGVTSLGEFFKFPRTAHLFDAGGSAVTRDDLLVGDPEFWIGSGRTILVEEKVDGGNLGISCNTNHSLLYQNRSHYVNEASHPQWVGLDKWGETHASALTKILEPERHILFGEWCTTVHSIEYTKLPSHFIAFDLYDRWTGQWVTRSELHKILAGSGIPVVPILTERSFETREDLIEMLDTKSQFREKGALEGLYLRHEVNGVVQRCKLVRPDFVQGITSHWMTGEQKKNRVTYDPDAIERSYTRIDADNCHVAVPETNLSVTDPRTRQEVILKSGQQISLPRNFSFVIPNVLLVSSIPTSVEQLIGMRQMGVRLVVTLTEESPLPNAWFTGENGYMENLFVPVANYEAPTIAQMDKIADAVGDVIGSGGLVVEHCGGGKGRAGTVAACLLLRYGPTGAPIGSNMPCAMPSNEAIQHVRELRPGSIETAAQEQFIREYATHLWTQHGRSNPNGAVLSKSVVNLEKEVKSKRQFEKEERARLTALRRAPDIILLVGIPGSGKSTFSSLLEKAGWVRCSQDDVGRSECERLAILNSKVGKRCVLDRCNVEPKDRKKWMETMRSPPPGRIAAVFFDVNLDDCIKRVERRTNHPTLNGLGHTEKIISDFSKRLVAPKKNEGFGAVFTIKTAGDCVSLISQFGILVEDLPTDAS